MELRLGDKYSRQEISEMLGGSPIAFLPFKDGKVTCGCFKLEEYFNPGAPEKVLFGRDYAQPAVEESVEMVRAQGQEGEAIPIFLFRGASQWEFVGHYRCIHLERSPAVLKKEMTKHPLRGEITGVLYFEKE